MDKIVVTGSAGFIGYSLSKKLLDLGFNVIGIDNHNNYYDPKIKQDRTQRLEEYLNYKHYKADLFDNEALNEITDDHRISSEERLNQLHAREESYRWRTE